MSRRRPAVAEILAVLESATRSLRVAQAQDSAQALARALELMDNRVPDAVDCAVLKQPLDRIRSLLMERGEALPTVEVAIASLERITRHQGANRDDARRPL